ADEEGEVGDDLSDRGHRPFDRAGERAPHLRDPDLRGDVLGLWIEVARADSDAHRREQFSEGKLFLCGGGLLRRVLAAREVYRDAARAPLEGSGARACPHFW